MLIINIPQNMHMYMKYTGSTGCCFSTCNLGCFLTLFKLQKCLTESSQLQKLLNCQPNIRGDEIKVEHLGRCLPIKGCTMFCAAKLHLPGRYLFYSSSLIWWSFYCLFWKIHVHMSTSYIQHTTIYFIYCLLITCYHVSLQIGKGDCTRFFNWPKIPSLCLVGIVGRSRGLPCAPLWGFLPLHYTCKEGDTEACWYTDGMKNKRGKVQLINVNSVLVV